MANNEFIDGGLTVNGTLTTNTTVQDTSALNVTGKSTLSGDVVLNNGTSTASSGAVTLNARAGVITTDSITTTGQSSYALTVTNSNVTATDILSGSVANGTNTTGIPVLTLAAGAGVITAKVFNAATTATNPFGGTLKVSFVAFKAS